MQKNGKQLLTAAWERTLVCKKISRSDTNGGFEYEVTVNSELNAL